jgi:hypothetical protein
LQLSPLAFVLKQSDSYSWPVTIKMPADGGKREKQTFTAIFKRLAQSRINEIQQEVQRRIKLGEAGEDVQGSISDVSLADEILVGWDDVNDGDGEAVPYSKTTKVQMLEVPMLASAIIEAYFESLVEQKRKN